MTKRRHKADMATFGELNHVEQAKSITATINNLAAAIRHHIRNGKNPDKIHAKCIAQLQRMLDRLR